jgi:hypothetical protein
MGGSAAIGGGAAGAAAVGASAGAGGAVGCCGSGAAGSIERSGDMSKGLTWATAGTTIAAERQRVANALLTNGPPRAAAQLLPAGEP